MNDIAGILKMMDSKISDAEFEEGLNRQRFLRTCKNARFTKLESLGLISHPKLEKEKRQDDRLLKAQKAARMINEELRPIAEVAKELGEPRSTLASILQATGTRYLSYTEQRDIKDDRYIEEIKRLLEAGVSYRKACESHGRSTHFTNSILRRRGYKFKAAIKQIVKAAK